MAREKRVIEMTTGSLWKNILLFSLPLMLTQLLDISSLWQILTALTAWSLVPAVLLLLLLTIARLCRRGKA